ncbi:MAG: histidine kinase, partial [Lachnospiraceae bacterium]|nr:histidine kinase [Lachnospiraceae bacterium]
MLILVSLLPLTILITYLLVTTNNVSAQYDEIVEKITKANEYNINFKDDLDYSMYIIVVNSERANEIIDTNKPVQMIDEAREMFGTLSEEADTEAARTRLSSIIKSLNTLRDRVIEIEESALTSGSYEVNMERLDLNIRVLTELIQEEIQFYIYEQTRNMEALKEGIRSRVEKAITITSILLVVILIGALTISRRIMEGITSPIRHLCRAAERAGSGDFQTRAHEEKIDEIAVLNESFNRMVEEIGKLVEDIRVEELNLRAAELRLLQEQINPHFLYNTLDNIIWLAESKETQQVVSMV